MTYEMTQNLEPSQTLTDDQPEKSWTQSMLIMNAPANQSKKSIFVQNIKLKDTTDERNNNQGAITAVTVLAVAATATTPIIPPPTTTKTKKTQVAQPHQTQQTQQTRPHSQSQSQSQSQSPMKQEKRTSFHTPRIPINMPAAPLQAALSAHQQMDLHDITSPASQVSPNDRRRSEVLPRSKGSSLKTVNFAKLKVSSPTKSEVLSRNKSPTISLKIPTPILASAQAQNQAQAQAQAEVSDIEQDIPEIELKRRFSRSGSLKLTISTLTRSKSKSRHTYNVKNNPELGAIFSKDSLSSGFLDAEFPSSSALDLASARKSPKSPSSSFATKPKSPKGSSAKLTFLKIPTTTTSKSPRNRKSTPLSPHDIAASPSQASDQNTPTAIDTNSQFKNSASQSASVKLRSSKSTSLGKKLTWNKLKLFSGGKRNSLQPALNTQYISDITSPTAAAYDTVSHPNQSSSRTSRNDSSLDPSSITVNYTPTNSSNCTLTDQRQKLHQTAAPATLPSASDIISLASSLHYKTHDAFALDDLSTRHENQLQQSECFEISPNASHSEPGKDKDKEDPYIFDTDKDDGIHDIVTEFDLWRAEDSVTNSDSFLPTYPRFASGALMSPLVHINVEMKQNSVIFKPFSILSSSLGTDSGSQNIRQGR